VSAPSRHRHRRAQAGFTLLETIVTLVVVSLIVVVLMQALQQALGLRTRLLRFERETRMSTLQEQWFRDTVSSAIPDLPDALGPIRGDAAALALVTAAPLRGAGPERIGWSLQAEGSTQALIYAGADKAPVRVVGGLRDAAFSYLDADGRWRNGWRQEEGRPPLPRMVRLAATTSTGPLLWLVPIAVDGREHRYLRLEELDVGL
jgi:prepilin-type N-terminal cleavage/methylation domain-containing protein